MSARVWVVGSLNIDLVCTVERHPVPGETVLAHELTRLPGGKGANQALGAVQAGASVTLVGATGDDDAGRAYVDALRRRGIRVEATRVPGVSTGHALVTVDARGQNTIVVVQGANAELGVDQVRTALRAVRAGDVLLVQLEIPLASVLAAAQAAQKAGATVVLNPSPWREPPDVLLENVDVLVVNEAEAAALGDVPASVSVCQTLGERGAVWDGVHAAADPVQPVDTTGAGDAFTGALAAGLAKGLPRRQVLTGAVRAGTAACLHPGAQPWQL